MPLATRADLEAVRGPQLVTQLLKEAGTGAPEQTARLDEALAAGDELIAQFLPLPSDPSDARIPVLRRLAIDEALYYLEANSRAGAGEAAVERAQLRRLDLSKMRDRKQFAGVPEKQSSISGFAAEWNSPMASTRMRGFL